MADFKASKIAATALKAIRQFGELTTFRSVGAPVVDPDAPWKATPGAPIERKVSAVWLSQTGLKREPLQYADGSSQRAGDMKVILGNDLVPAPDLEMVLTRPSDGMQWKVKAITPIAPSGVPLVYELWVQQ